MCKAITRHCCSGKLLQKMHDVTFFHVFVGGGGQWWYVFIKFYISNSVLRSIQIRKNAFTVYERKQIWPSIISLLVATMRQYTKLLVLWNCYHYKTMLKESTVQLCVCWVKQRTVKAYGWQKCSSTHSWPCHEVDVRGHLHIWASVFWRVIRIASLMN